MEHPISGKDCSASQAYIDWGILGLDKNQTKQHSNKTLPNQK
jgi:hypothetical protein